MHFKNWFRWIFQNKYEDITLSTLEESFGDGTVIVYLIMINQELAKKKPRTYLIIDLDPMEEKEVGTLINPQVMSFLLTFRNQREKYRKEISEESPCITNIELERLVKLGILEKYKVVNQKVKRRMNVYLCKYSVIYLRYDFNLWK